MKNFKFASFSVILFFVFALTAFSTAANAQETEKQTPEAAQNDKRGEPLFRQLNLSPEQIKQIQAIHRETRDKMREAAQRQRAARRALDAAIYADNSNAAEVGQRAREFGEAQAELSKLRAAAEFRVRQILNAQQLALFRELRLRAMEQAAGQRQNEFGSPRQNRQKRLPLKNRSRF